MGAEHDLRLAPDQQKIGCSGSDIAVVVETHRTAARSHEPIRKKVSEFPFTAGSGVDIQYVQKKRSVHSFIPTYKNTLILRQNQLEFNDLATTNRIQRHKRIPTHIDRSGPKQPFLARTV